MANYPSPSVYQQAILDAVRNTVANILIEAVAGSGKSTTLEMIFGEATQSGRVSKNDAILLAFNKSVKLDLLSRNLPADTFHALGLKEIGRHFNTRLRVNFNKTGDVMKSIMSREEMKDYGSVVSKLVSAAYTVGLVPSNRKTKNLYALTEDTEENWFGLIDRFGIDTGDDIMGHFIAGAIDIACDVLTRCLLDTNQISGDDMLAMPVVYGMNMRKYKLVGVDEAQDSAPIQLAFLDKIIDPKGGRIIAVGDRNQQLYTFRGADSMAMDRIKERYECIEFPLSICYRCPLVVVEAAKEYVPQIEARPNAPEGIYQALDTYGPDIFNPGDLIVCRMNAPTISLAYRLISARKPVVVLGRDIGQGLISKIKKVKEGYERNGTGEEIEWLIEQLTFMCSREIDKALAQDNERKVDAIQDKYDTLDMVISSSEKTTMNGIIQEIQQLFGERKDTKGKIVLSTIHKIKGGQARTVYWLDHSLKCQVRTPEDEHTERCCRYVATTRAQNALYLIESDGYLS